MKKFSAVLIALLFSMVGSMSPTFADDAVAGSGPENPIVVTSPDEVPEGAVEDAESTYNTDSQCDKTRSWTVTTLATEAETHEESRFKRDVPAVEGVAHHTYSKMIEHPYIPQVTQTEMQWRRHVTLQERSSAVGWKKDWVIQDEWFKEGEEPYDKSDGTQWRICNQRYIYDDEGNNTYVKEYQWHHYIIVQEAIPAKPLIWEWQYSTLQFDDATVPSADLPMENEGLFAKAWSRNVNKVNIVAPAVAAWSETIYYDGKPGGSTDEGDAAWVSYVPGDGPWNASEVRYDPAPADGYTEYYLEGSEEPSRDQEDASWIASDNAPEGFEVLDTRTVVDREATDESVVHYAWSDGVECAVPAADTPESGESVTPIVESDKPDKVVAADPESALSVTDPESALPDTGMSSNMAVASLLGFVLATLGTAVLLRRKP